MFLAAFTASQTKYISYQFAKIRAKNPRNVTLSPFLKRIPACPSKFFLQRTNTDALTDIQNLGDKNYDNETSWWCGIN